MYTIKIVRGNIVNVTTEAIVNPANNNLMPGGGANKMIFYASGDRLIEECAKLKYCETGKAVYTSGFNIPAKYIIHAVGPYWHGGYDDEAKKLASCYISIMKIAEQLGLKSIGIPALCTGKGGYPIDEAIDIAVSSVVSYLQSHNLDMDVWFMCYDNDTLLKYRTKNTEGVGDVSKYFERKEIKIDAKLNNEEKSILKKKLFKKEISKEQELDAVNAVLKRIIKKKYPDCVYLPAPKKKESISMKTCDKYERSGPFITMDCVDEYSYDKERMQIRLTPYCFVDTPDELESKKRYFTDEDNDGIPDDYNKEARSYEQAHKTLKVLNIESMLSNLENDAPVVEEYVDVDKSNVQIADLEDENEQAKADKNNETVSGTEQVDTNQESESTDINNTENETVDGENEESAEESAENNDGTPNVDTSEFKKKKKKNYHPNYKPNYK